MLGRVEVWLLIPLSCLGSLAIGECPKGDLTGDCEVDFRIEIYNAGHYAIDTGGMHLTDELGSPTKWQISTTNPSATTIQPGDKNKFGRQHYIRIDRVTYSDGAHDEDVPGGVDRIRRLC